MKKIIYCLTVTGLLVSSVARGFAQEGERVYLRDMSEPVKKAIRAKQGDDDVRRIEKITQDGQNVYKVLLNRSGNNTFMVSESGSIVTALPARSAANRSTTLTELPKAVQDTFRREASSSKISDIQKTTVNVYEIQYSQDGEQGELVVTEDGSIIQDRLSQNRDRRNRSIRGDSTNYRARDDRNAAGFDRPLAATRKVNLDDVPEAVKRTAREVASSNRIDDTERGTLDGKVIYEIAFKNDGEHNEVRIAEDGSILQRVSGENIRYPGALTVDEVPGSVRRAIRDQVGSGEVNDIDKLTIDGKTVYEVGFKREKGGAQNEIRIAEDGQIIGDPAGSRRD